MRDFMPLALPVLHFQHVALDENATCSLCWKKKRLTSCLANAGWFLVWQACVLVGWQVDWAGGWLFHSVTFWQGDWHSWGGWLVG